MFYRFFEISNAPPPYGSALITQELNISLKKNVEALKLSSKYTSNLFQSKSNTNQWISLLFHEHSRSSAILKQQLYFMMGIFMSQAMMQLGLSQACLPPDQQRQSVRQILLEKTRKRKNNTNKYYELNLQMIDRFYQAQKQFHEGNKQKSLQLLHFTNIQSDFQKMPQNKIITNIYSALSYHNIGIIHYSYGKPSLALHYFNKAQTLLSKGCTGVEDKDLQLFSSNYSSHSHKIYYNLGIVSLGINQTQAYQILQQLKKSSSQCCDFKYWYRIGQAQLEHFHQAHSKIPKQNRLIILQSALKSFNQSLFCLQKKQIPSLNLSKTLQILKQQQIQAMIMKVKGQDEAFRQSIRLIICYICLFLNQFHKVIKHGKQLLENQKSKQLIKFYALQYMMEAYTKLQRYEQASKCMNQIQKVDNINKKMEINIYHLKNNKKNIIKDKMDIDSILFYQNLILKLKQKSISINNNNHQPSLEKQYSKLNNKCKEIFKNFEYRTKI